MTYRAPLADIAAALKSAALPSAIDEGLFGDLTMDDVDAVVAEAGRFAAEVIAPLNRVGDRHGTPFKDGAVDFKSYERLIEHYLALGVDGLFPLGTTPRRLR